MKNREALSRSTQLIYAAELEEKNEITPEAMPIYQTSAFKLEDFDQQDAVYDRGEGYVYSRVKSPNRVALAQTMNFLEHGKHSLICTSGLSAITLGLMSVVKAGDHILASEAIYGETIYIISTILAEYGVEVTYADFNDEEAARKAVRPNTKLMYLEIASNPLQVVTDIRKVVKVARECGLKVMVDNTFTTPFVINPLEYGADIVVHSLTKFMNGHFDMIGGSITTTDEELYKRGFYMKQFIGCGLAPHDCWLACRSMATAEMRIKKQMDNAMAVARAVERHPAVEKVYYPGLESSEYHSLAGELYRTDYGYGAMLSFTIRNASIPDCDRFFKNLNIIKFVNTLGGYKTTICHPATSGHRDVSQEIRDTLGITDGFVRISCGVEDARDLVDDLLRALDKTVSAKGPDA